MGTKSGKIIDKYSPRPYNIQLPTTKLLENNKFCYFNVNLKLD